MRGGDDDRELADMIGFEGNNRARFDRLGDPVAWDFNHNRSIGIDPKADALAAVDQPDRAGRRRVAAVTRTIGTVDRVRGFHAQARLGRRPGLTGVDTGDPRRVDSPLAAEEDEGDDDRDSEERAERDPHR